MNEMETHVESHMELDSHANMLVVGKHAYIIDKTGKKVDVSPFTPDYKLLTVPLVDATVEYDNPYDGKIYILVLRISLYVPSMDHNLIPPFMLREMGVTVNDVPKIHKEDPTVDNDAITFAEMGFRIPLSLWGILSYFPTSKPMHDDLLNLNEVYILSPATWNPHSDAYSANEESMLDWEGNMQPKKDHQHRIVLDDVEDDVNMVASLSITPLEQEAIDTHLIEDDERFIPRSGACVLSILGSISNTLVDLEFSHHMCDKERDGRIATSIGSTSTLQSRYISDSETEADEQSHDGSTCNDVNECLDSLSDLDGDREQAMVDEYFSHSSIASRPRGVTPEHLSKIWCISHEDAKRMIDMTTQTSVRTQDPTLSRNYGTNDCMLCYRRIQDYFFMDTFFATKKGGRSSQGHTCCQLFVTDKGFLYVVPMRRKSEVLQALKQFAKEINAPTSIIANMSGEQTSHDIRKFCNDIGTTLRALEEGTPWSYKAELYIGLLKEAVQKDMHESNSPMVLWDYCVERRVRINNLTAKDNFQLHGTTPHTTTIAGEGDISSLCQFGWYEWCYYREQTAAFPHNREVLGRVLGPACGEGNEMAQWVLKANGKVMPQRSLRPLTIAEHHSPVEHKKRDVFDALIERRMGTSINPPPAPEDRDPTTDDPTNENNLNDDNEMDGPVESPNHEDILDSMGRILEQQPAFDKIINAEVMIQNGDEMAMGKVTRRSLDADGRTTGTYHDNPFLNTITYDVEFPDGQVKEYGANIIAENMLTQVDSDGYSLSLMDSIIDHQRDPSQAIPMEEKYIMTKSGQKRLRKATKGWKLLIKWKDKSKAWINLVDMKEVDPVETAEYARARGISNEPAFAWWVPYTLRKREIILAAVKNRIQKTTHKYGIEIPRDVEHAHEIDSRNGNTMWRDALKKQMYNVGVAFEILDEGAHAPHGWKRVTGHLVWDVKMDFTRKARWVLDGHKTPDPIGSTYAAVVSRESVHIALTYAAWNELDVFAADIRNAYLRAPSSQKD